MEKYDQLGLIRPEKYRSRYHSIGLDIDRLHAQTTDEELDGETIIVVRDWNTTQIGETALYAAFVQHNTGEKITIHSHHKELDIDDLPELVIPYMSDGEIAQRFEAIEGADALTEADQKTVVRAALLIQTHFMRLIYDYDGIEYETLEFDEEF